MPRPSQIGSYRVHMDAMDLAEVNPSGAIVNFQTRAQATRFRAMCYSARKIYQEQTGQAKWTEMVIQLHQGPDFWQVHIQRAAMKPVSVVPLDGQYPEKTTFQEYEELIEATVQEALRPPTPVSPSLDQKKLGRSSVRDPGDLDIEV